MEEKNPNQEAVESNAEETVKDLHVQAQEDIVRDRRAFLTRAAMGMAGAAGLVALGSSSAQAADTHSKSKILEVIKIQMAAEDGSLDQSSWFEKYEKIRDPENPRKPTKMT